MNEFVKKMEEALLNFPVMEYAFCKTEEIEFSKSVRWICENECERYGKSWACPPNFGTIDECVEKCKAYEHCLIFSSIVEVDSFQNFNSCFKVKAVHEELTYEIAKVFREMTDNPLILSSGCLLCDECSYPDAPCRNPERAFPTLESHGIMIIPVAEKYGMSFDCTEFTITYFSMIFFNEK
ncbi:MAG: DUF2284 domain-containing protein [Anaerofustis stercorihominis]|nr:DUF2284 domain-containing protein [Anaerofustis stercorihominis]